MNVSLPAEQLKWLEAQVAAGHFSSIDEALAIAVADLKALSEDDLAWAKPYVDQAREESVLERRCPANSSQNDSISGL
jgi:Arc/MetJ-type ribon-helix-helix transcriptional regulator